MTAEQYYLREVFERILERGRAARHAARQQRESNRDQAEFLSGVSQGYYEVVAYMLGQLDAFDIPRSSVGVPDIISPEDELL